VSVISLQHRTGMLARFLTGCPPQQVDYLAPRIERRATVSGAEPRFCNLSITSLALYKQSCVPTVIRYVAGGSLFHCKVIFLFEAN